MEKLERRSVVEVVWRFLLTSGSSVYWGSCPGGRAVVSEAAERTMLENIDGPLKSFPALGYFETMCWSEMGPFVMCHQIKIIWLITLKPDLCPCPCSCSKVLPRLEAINYPNGVTCQMKYDCDIWWAGCLKDVRVLLLEMVVVQVAEIPNLAHRFGFDNGNSHQGLTLVQKI